MANPSSKTELRRLLLTERALLRPHVDERHVLEALLPVLEEGLILSYSSFSSEVPTHSFNAYLLKQNRLVLPRIESGNLLLYKVDRLSLEMNALGMLEPPANEKNLMSIDDISTVIVPGIAFDTDCYRLGYGRGCYDRLLLALSPAVKMIGLTYKELLLEEHIPTDPWDIPVSVVVTL